MRCLVYPPDPLHVCQCNSEPTVIALIAERKGKKGKEEYLYSDFSHQGIHTKRSGIDHTDLPANNTMPALVCR